MSETPTRPTLFGPFLFIDELGGGWFCLLPPSPPRSRHQLPAARRRVPGNVARHDPTSSTPSSAIIPLFVFGDPCGAHEIARIYWMQLPADLGTIGNTAPTAAVLWCWSAVQTAPFATRRRRLSRKLLQNVVLHRFLRRHALGDFRFTTQGWFGRATGIIIICFRLRNSPPRITAESVLFVRRRSPTRA